MQSDLKKTIIMGILNLTPDSFSGDGIFNSPELACQYAAEMQNNGAQIIDVGAESTKPNAKIINAEEELRRLNPVVKKLLENNFLISVDTYKEETAIAMLKLGIKIINSVAVEHSETLISAIKKYNARLIVTHSLTVPVTEISQINDAEKIMPILLEYFEKKINELEKFGLTQQQIIIDPGFGFGKSFEVNQKIIEELSALKQFGLPVLAGLSRKRFVKEQARINNLDLDEMSVLLEVNAAKNGADIIRTHNVKKLKNKLGKL